MRPSHLAACLVLLAAFVAPVRADDFGGVPTRSDIALPGSYASPHSFGLLPRALFDPTRFSIRNSMTFGYQSGGAFGGSSGLFTSSLGYRLRSNAALRVDLGAHMNPAFGGGDTQKGVFLQGASFDWRPSQSSLLRFEYRDVRSPLQGGWGYGGYSGQGYGYAGPVSGGVSPGDPFAR
jgi:hypothetical protein